MGDRIDVRTAAAGRWRSILTTLGMNEKALSGKHCACPMCGGKDRFRFDDKDGRGTYYCSGCGAGDGVKLAMGITSLSFKDAAREIERLAGVVQPVTGKPERTDEDKLAAYQTLYEVLVDVAVLGAPIAPFYVDQLFLDLVAVTGRENVESVHLSDFPVYDESKIDKNLEERMQMAQDVSSMVLALRRKVNIKVRQPLHTVMIPVVDAHQQESIEAVKNLILNEVNVKELKFVDNTAGILVKKIKPDFKKLGPRYGKIMKALAATIQSMSQEDINAFEKAGTFTLMVDGQEAVLERTDVEIISEDIPGWLVANEGRLTVALDITVTEDLRKEGLARELVNRIQNLRKSSGFDITDKIHVSILSCEEMDEAIYDYKDYIANQVLAESIEIMDNAISDATELDFEDFKLSVKIEKA